jgi:acyl carrier protein
MQRKEIIELVNNFMVDEFEIEPEQLRDNTLLRDDLEIESLDLVDIIVMIEKEFKIKIKPEEIVKVQSMRELYDFIEIRVNPSQNA